MDFDGFSRAWAALNRTVHSYKPPTDNYKSEKRSSRTSTHEDEIAKRKRIKARRAKKGYK